jgi:hypothetical protein
MQNRQSIADQDIIIRVYPNDETAPLNEIIALKRQHWPYSFDSHLSWMRDNLAPNDEHVCCFSQNSMIAYMNLVNVPCKDGDSEFTVIGVGNVCVLSDLQGCGIGTRFVKATTDIIASRNKVGLLFCSENLVPFYQRCGWMITDRFRVVSADSKILSKKIMVTDDKLIHCAIFAKAF